MKTVSTFLFAASALALAACQQGATDNNASNAVENASEAIENAAESIENASEALEAVDANATGDKPAGDAAPADTTAAGGDAGDKPTE